MPVDGYSSSAASASEAELYGVGYRCKTSTPYVLSDDSNLSSRYEAVHPAITPTDSIKRTEPTPLNLLPMSQIHSVNSSASEKILDISDHDNYSVCLERLGLQKECIINELKGSFPHLNPFLKSVVQLDVISDQLKDLEEIVHKYKSNALMNEQLPLIYSFLCIAYTGYRKFGKAEQYHKKAKELLSQEGFIHTETFGWFHLAYALYNSSLPDSKSSQNKERKMKIQIQLQKARTHFLYVESSAGESCKLLKAMCLWWQVYVAVSDDNYQEKVLIHGLSENDALPEWSYQIKHLTDAERATHIIMLQKCESEIKEIMGKDLALKENMSKTIQKMLCVMSTEKRKVTKRKNISLKERFHQFETDIAKLDLPDFIQTFHCSEARLKIFIDINRGRKEDAKMFCRRHFLELWSLDMIILVEQDEPEYLMMRNYSRHFHNEESYAAFVGQQVSYAHYCLKSGSQIMGLTPSFHSVVLEDQSISTIEDIQRKYVRRPSGSLGGVMRDQNEQPFLVTASHPLVTLFQNNEYIPKPGYQQNDPLAVIGEIQKDNKGTLITIGNNISSSLYHLETSNPNQGLVDKRKAVDIAAIRIKDGLMETNVIQESFKNINGEAVNMTVYNESDANLLGRNVQKSGHTTQTTCGKIIFVNRKTTIDKKSCSGVFVVRGGVPRKTKEFAQKGDSGSFVISWLGAETQATAYGICHRIHRNYHDAELDVTVGHVTWCVRLDLGLQFLRQFCNLDLSFTTIPSTTTMSSPVSTYYNSASALYSQSELNTPTSGLPDSPDNWDSGVEFGSGSSGPRKQLRSTHILPTSPVAPRTQGRLRSSRRSLRIGPLDDSMRSNRSSVAPSSNRRTRQCCVIL